MTDALSDEAVAGGDRRVSMRWWRRRCMHPGLNPWDRTVIEVNFSEKWYTGNQQGEENAETSA